MAPGSHYLGAWPEVWPGNRLAIILTEPYLSDHWIVLALLKSLKAEVLENSISVTYPVQMSDFSVEVRKELDVFMEVQLLAPVWPSLSISRYTGNTTPHPLKEETGLSLGMTPVGKYMEFLPSEDIQSETSSNIDYVRFKIYYTALRHCEDCCCH